MICVIQCSHSVDQGSTFWIFFRRPAFPHFTIFFSFPHPPEFCSKILTWTLDETRISTHHPFCWLSEVSFFCFCLFCWFRKLFLNFDHLLLPLRLLPPRANDVLPTDPDSEKPETKWIFSPTKTLHTALFFINVTLQPQTEKSHPFAKSSNFYPLSDIRRGGKSRFFTLKNAPPPCLRFSHLHRFCNFTGKDRKTRHAHSPRTENRLDSALFQAALIFFSNQSTTFSHFELFDATGRKTET